MSLRRVTRDCRLLLLGALGPVNAAVWLNSASGSVAVLGNQQMFLRTDLVWATARRWELGNKYPILMPHCSEQLLLMYVSIRKKTQTEAAQNLSSRAVRTLLTTVHGPWESCGFFWDSIVLFAGKKNEREMRGWFLPGASSESLAELSRHYVEGNLESVWVSHLISRIYHRRHGARAGMAAT